MHAIARRNNKLELDCRSCKIDAVMSRCGRGHCKQHEHSSKQGLEVGVGMLHPEGKKSKSKEPTLVACLGPTGLASKEEVAPIGVVCSGPTILEEKRSEDLLQEGWS